ncbi:hypothetical protein HZS_4396 [Henneguya salminicola]|nr:hypothetical protein HZS_4396 [Henneguya salminicola]
MRNLCEPSIKYFKYIYLQLRSFAQIFINFYKIQNFENPLVCFLENYQSNYNIQYSIRCINNLYNTNYIGSVEKYRPNSQAKYSTDVKDTSILKISYDFSRSVKHIFGRIRCIPLHAADFIKLYCDTFHESLFKNFMTTINGLTVVNDITILAAQISNSLPEYEIMQVFELFKDYNASWIDVMLCSFIQSQPLTQDHVMSAVNFKLLVVIFENLKYLSTITSDFSSRVFSVGNFEKVYHNNKHVTCGLSKFIYTPACLKDLVSEAMSTDVLSPLSLINDEIGQLLHRCLTILLFDARFHVALYLQALFKISDLDPTYIHPNIYQLEKYLHSIYESIMHLSSKKISSFLFFHLTNFIHIYLIEMAKNDIHIKARASFIRRCVYVLKIQLIDSHLSNIHILDETISFFDLFEMDLDEILKSVIEKGPIFTFQTYSIVINAIKDQSLSSDLFNLRIKTLKEYFSEDSYQL